MRSIDENVADLLGGCVLRCVAVQAGATATSVGWYGSCREVLLAAAVVCKFCPAPFSAPVPKSPRTRSRSTPRPSLRLIVPASVNSRGPLHCYTEEKIAKKKRKTHLKLL